VGPPLGTYSAIRSDRRSDDRQRAHAHRPGGSACGHRGGFATHGVQPGPTTGEGTGGIERALALGPSPCATRPRSLNRQAPRSSTPEFWAAVYAALGYVPFTLSAWRLSPAPANASSGARSGAAGECPPADRWVQFGLSWTKCLTLSTMARRAGDKPVYNAVDNSVGKKVDIAHAPRSSAWWSQQVVTCMTLANTAKPLVFHVKPYCPRSCAASLRPGGLFVARKRLTRE
jgi:hypothetical protein